MSPESFERQVAEDNIYKAIKKQYENLEEQKEIGDQQRLKGMALY